MVHGATLEQVKLTLQTLHVTVAMLLCTYASQVSLAILHWIKGELYTVNEQTPAYFARITGFCLLHSINHFPRICCQVSHQLTITAVACFVFVVVNATEAHPL